MSEKVAAAAAEEFLTLEEIVSTADVEYATVVAWGGKKVRLASVTAEDIIFWSESNEGEAKRTAGLRLILKSIVDKDGKRMMEDSHLSILRKKSHKITEDIVKAILKLNGMNVKAEADAKKD